MLLSMLRAKQNHDGLRQSIKAFIQHSDCTRVYKGNKSKKKCGHMTQYLIDSIKITKQLTMRTYVILAYDKVKNVKKKGQI